MVMTLWTHKRDCVTMFAQHHGKHSPRLAQFADPQAIPVENPMQQFQDFAGH
jgi:hypothetical protein